MKKYKLLQRISKHNPGEIWEVRERECVFITSTQGVTSEFTPSGNWEPYFLRDNQSNSNYFMLLDTCIKKTNGGLFVVDPARRNVTEYLSHVFEDDGIALNAKVNELIDAVNILVKTLN